MKRSIHGLFATFLLGILMVVSAVPTVHAAGTAQLYAKTTTSSVASGQNIRVELHVGATNAALNMVQPVVHFPADKLAYVGLDKSDSYFDTFVPATPEATNGTVTFAAAALGKTATDEQLVATLVFQAKASSGTASISLDGSVVANDGQPSTPAVTGASVSFEPSSGANNTLAIQDVQVRDITVNNATVHWTTDVPASSSIDYGSTASYGFSGGSGELVTQHSVKLDEVFGGAATVHFRITSVAANGASQTVGDKTFKTRGYTVSITVKDEHGSVLSGADVRVAGAEPVKADAKGVARVENVAPGNQKVVINGGKTQFVTIKAVNGKPAAQVQAFTLEADKAGTSWWLIGVLIAAVAVLAVAGWLWKQRRAAPAQPSK